MAEESSPGKVKVVDRRWFTAEGELREDLPHAANAAAADPQATETGLANEPAQATEASTAAHAAAPAADPERFNYSLPSGLLLNLADFLAQNALALLGGTTPGVERNPNAARLFIDLLDSLRRMTHDQVSLQEARVLDDLLFQLRTLSVASTR